MLIRLLLVSVWTSHVSGSRHLPDSDGVGDETRDDFQTDQSEASISGIHFAISSSLNTAIEEYFRYRKKFNPQIIDDMSRSPNGQSQHTNSPIEVSMDMTLSNEANSDFFTIKKESEELTTDLFESQPFNPRSTLPFSLQNNESVGDATAEIASQRINKESEMDEFKTEFGRANTKMEARSHAVDRPHDLCDTFNMNLQDYRSKAYIPARPYWRKEGPVCKEDDFAIGKEIGKGAQGEVFFAVHKPSGTKVALKYLTSAKERKRFAFTRMEECLQDRLNGSPFITEHYCTFISETHKPSLAVLALQLIEDAVDMWDFVYLTKWNDAAGGYVRHFQYDEQTVATITAQMISATWYMHQMHVVYRDMKVENILLRPNGDIMLLDFGLSSDPAKPCHLSSNKLLGTPYYFAPEYCKPGRPRFVAMEADWYALGIIVYELAFRDGPFPQTPGIRIEELARYISKGFKCVAKEPKWDSLCDLVNQLCDPDPKLRLGNLSDSYDTFQNHPFLATTEISTLLKDAEILVQMKKFIATGLS